MRHTRKWLSLALALVLVFALSLPALATAVTWAEMADGNVVLEAESAYTPQSVQAALNEYQRFNDTWNAGHYTEARTIFYNDFKSAILGLEFKAHTFTDAPRGQWFDQALDYVCSTGKMNGVAPGMFDPQGTMTRAMAVTILWRVNGEPAPKTAAGFSDVPNDQWYSNAVAWAVENEITNGTTSTTFSPNAPVTREQMATFFSRMIIAPNENGDSSSIDSVGSLLLIPAYRWRLMLQNQYSDANQISEYALMHVGICLALEVMKGNADGTFAPQANITRAQGAQMLLNYYNLMLENTFDA